MPVAPASQGFPAGRRRQTQDGRVHPHGRRCPQHCKTGPDFQTHSAGQPTGSPGGGTRAGASFDPAEPSRAAASRACSRRDGVEVESVAETTAITETVTEIRDESYTETAQSATEMGTAGGQVDREGEGKMLSETVQPEADEPGPQEKARVTES